MDPKTARLLHWEGRLPEVGEYLETRSGSVYAVIQVKPNTRPNPKSVAKLDLLKLTSDDIQNMPLDATIHHFAWTGRSR